MPLLRRNQLAIASRQTSAWPAWYVEVGEHFLVALFVDAAFERLPIVDQPFGVAGTFVVRIVDVLDQRLAGVEHVVVGHVVHEQQQLVRAGFERFVDARRRARDTGR